MSLTTEEMYDWWNNAAKDNAMAAILSGDVDWDKSAFFKTGETSLDDFRAFASLSSVQLGGDVALDFGCGLGRMTQALTKHYRRAIGIDISMEMVRLARQHAGSAPVEYIQVLQPPCHWPVVPSICRFPPS